MSSYKRKGSSKTRRFTQCDDADTSLRAFGRAETCRVRDVSLLVSKTGRQYVRVLRLPVRSWGSRQLNTDHPFRTEHPPLSVGKLQEAFPRHAPPHPPVLGVASRKGTHSRVCLQSGRCGRLSRHTASSVASVWFAPHVPSVLSFLRLICLVW